MRRVAASLACAACLLGAAGADGPDRAYGPYNAEFPAGGDGLVFPLDVSGPQYGWAREQALANAKPAPVPPGDWTLFGWVRPSESGPGRVVIGGVGDPASGGRFLVLEDGRLAAWSVVGEATSQATLSSNAWHFVAAVQRGATVWIFADGRMAAEGALAQGPVISLMQLAPRGVGTPFAGRLAGFTEEPRALADTDIADLAAHRPDFDLIVFASGSPSWPIQTHQMFGQKTPQDAWTLPRTRAPNPYSPPVAKPAYDGPSLLPKDWHSWALAKWRLSPAPDIAATGEALSRPGYDMRGWRAATVPGTVLQTLIDRGVYPDPDYGLNNLAIPESLHDQDYWYRTEFVGPFQAGRRHFFLSFNGINYAAEIWVNGARVGTMKGAFTRGRFDVSRLVRPGRVTAVAVKVSPVPHPGIAEEESVAAGVGENGGIEALDGPTFIASEGWDWLPSVRDRNTGLWQGVALQATGDVRIGDVQVVTTLPKPDNSVADVEIDIPIVNLSKRRLRASIRAAFDGVAIVKPVELPPGTTTIRLAPAEFHQLSVHHPKLWWPNGYGAPSLHMLRVTAMTGKTMSDRQDIRFGMRQITYNLSLMDDSGHLDRVALDLSKARALGSQIVDVRHAAIRKTPGGWVYSLYAGAESSPALQAADDVQLAPYLVLKVNGVKIAARGGSWGTDDWLKRIDRVRLEPFFRLHRDAHVNVIRNWVGQNTEPVFYDLADEYGILVLNDFWESTQDYQIEAEDVPLFLANAADTVARYRNHPSIALWFGRNEGVPQPVLNEGLEKLVREEDGTRLYMPSSNRIDLHDSGPYDYRDPVKYFTEYSGGFAVEVGAPSFPTLEAFEAAVPEADRWPPGDVWAYHDWHPDGNGATKGFVDAMTAKFGAPTSLEDFTRKAQMLNYETYRAIFEGMNAKLWTANSGRLLWMTQPAWPSTNWQILSHDYDTHAAYYGFKAAGEPVHVQMDMPDRRLGVVNNTLAPIDVYLEASVHDLQGRELLATRDRIAAPANAVVHGRALDLDAALAASGVLIVELRLSSPDGRELSRNLYWLAGSNAAERKLSDLMPQPVTIRADASRDRDEIVVHAVLRNTGSAPALQAKMTLLDAGGRRILPVYYDDNYVSLLPGEERNLTMRYPAAAATSAAQIALSGWDVQPATVSVAGP